LPHAFLTVAREVRNHTFKPGIIKLGMREQVVDLVLNPRLTSRIPSATRRTLDSTRALIAAGKFSLPSAPTVGAR